MAVNSSYTLYLSKYQSLRFKCSFSRDLVKFVLTVIKVWFNIENINDTFIKMVMGVLSTYCLKI